jgi:spoIIIJ-associated protein
MEELEENVYSGKTVEEAVEIGLTSLGIAKEDAKITVLEEGKKKLFGAVKARVKVEKKASDGERAQIFVDGLFDVLKIKAVTELVSDGERIEINVETTNSHTVIGHHGEFLDAIQCIAGAVANIGREEYKKVVVDCENYREHRENTLNELANKLAKKAVEKGRKMKLEPMNPYERRIIHAALANSTEVKTVSDGKEPNRYVVIVPNNLKPFERTERRFDNRRSNNGGHYNNNNGERRNNNRGDRQNGDRPYNKERQFNGDRRQRNNQNASGAPRTNSRPAARNKKDFHFGTYLGNSTKQD